MKKIIILLLVLVLVGCGNENKKVEEKESTKNDTTANEKVENCVAINVTFKINFDVNEGDEVEPITYTEDLDKDLPTPKKSGYKFLGWYYEKDFKNEVKAKKIKDIIISKEVDKNNCITKYNDLTLYAKWEKEKEKEKAKEVSSSSKTSYYCDEGYTLDGKKCSKTETVSANVSYSCENPSDNLDGSKCISTTSVNPIVNYTCSGNGTYYVVDDECIEYTSDDEDTCTAKGGYIDPMSNKCGITREKLQPSCDDWQQYGSFIISGNACVEVTNAIPSYSCSDGYTISGSNCTKLITINAKTR